MPFAEINNAKINYEAYGDGEPLLLITGIGGDINFFRSLIPLVADGYRTVVYENRGVGSTEYEGDFTCQDLVDDAKAMLDWLGIEKAHVLGWSMGSQIAMELSIQHPEKVQTLTLVSAFEFAPARSIYMMNDIVDLCIERDLPAEYFIEATNLFSLTEEYFAKKRDAGQKMKRVSNSTPEKIRQQLRCLERFDLRGRTGALKMPILSVHGLDDIMVDPKLGDMIAKQVSIVEIVRIEKTGHLVHPSLYSDALMKFLKKYPIP